MHDSGVKQISSPRSGMHDRNPEAGTPRATVNMQSNFHRALGNTFMSRITPAPRQTQAKLKVGDPGDAYEREADRLADSVMNMPASPQSAVGVTGAAIGVQRKCAACKREDEQVLRRKPMRSDTDAAEVHAGKLSGLGGGRPLDTSTRGFFESRFNRNFGHVRIHDDGQSAAFASNINARAFTLGSHIGFASGQYTPETQSGRRLLAHELTHVVQQGETGGLTPGGPLKIENHNSALESQARNVSQYVAQGGDAHSVAVQAPANSNTVYRADPDAVERVGAMGITPGTGIQFFPANVTDTQVGPVGIQGGLLNARANRLNIIIGEHLTPRLMARLILPLWTTATPFTSPSTGAPVPVDIIDEETLAKGLMVYNRYYLGLPDMSKWRVGLRFPLPVLIDEVTGIATLHPTVIRNLSTAFDAAWLPLLDTPAAAVAAVPAATLTADVTAFLGRETTAKARGMHLSARARTNAVAELPFIREVFVQLGAGGFDVALGFMDSMVNRGISLLAAQRDGAAILAEIQAVLAAPPAVLTAEQQSSLDRANVMLGLIAGVVAQPPPTARRTRAEKTVVIDTLKLDGSTHNPATQIAIANGIFSQCNVRIQHGVDADDSRAAAPFTTTWLGGDTDLRTLSGCGSITADERRLYQGGISEYGMGGGRISVFFVASVTGIAGGGYSCPNAPGVHALRRHKSVVNNTGSSDTLAHELGHHFIDHNPSESHSLPGVMHGRPRATVTLNDNQCRRIYDNV